MGLSAALSSYLPPSSSLQRSKFYSIWLNGKWKRLALVAFPKRVHHSLIIKSVFEDSKSSINDNGASESARILFERLFAQTQKLVEMGSLPKDGQLGLNLGILESDLQAALTALKKKEEDLQDAERKVLLEHTELNRAKEALVRREKVKLEEELNLANSNLASQATQIEDLKVQIKQREGEISAAQYAHALKEDEMNKMKNELIEKSEEAVNIAVELKSKAHLLDEANAIVKKQEVEILQLRKAIQGKEEELEVSASLRKREEEKLKVTQANLEKQTTEWLLAQEELKKLAEEASKHNGEAHETMEDFRRVKKLLAGVRSELVSSQKALASSRQKMEDQEQLLQKQLRELGEQKRSVTSYMRSLKDAQIDVESERVKLRVAVARNKELERDLSMEKELIEQLQEEIDKERSLLEQAIEEKSFLQEELDRENTKFGEMHDLLQVKESELLDARLEIPHLKSEEASLQLILGARELELTNAGKKLKEVNAEIFELRTLVNSTDEQFMEATSILKEKEELRRKSIEMELKLKSQQDEKLDTESTNASFAREKSALEELDMTKKQLEDLSKRHEELEVKSKADIKVLVKEVKSLRSSQAELKKDHSQSRKEKSEAERLLQLESQCQEHAKIARKKLLHVCGDLQNRLQECSINLLAENGENLVVDSSTLQDALDLLSTSDNQIDLLLAEVQHLAPGDDNVSVDELHQMDDETKALDDELRKMLKDIFTDNAGLRKQVNSVLRFALKTVYSSEKDDEGSLSSEILQIHL